MIIMTEEFYGTIDLRRAPIESHEQMRIETQRVMARMRRLCRGMNVKVLAIYITPEILKHLRLEVFEQCQDQDVAESYIPGRQFGIDVEVMDADVPCRCAIHDHH